MIEAIILTLIAVAAACLTIHAAAHRKGDSYLCDTCQFNSPADCLKEDRPQSLVCYAYRCHK